MDSHSQLGILIPSWNNLPMLQLCLQSITRHSEFAHQIVVHVNEGTDGTLAWLQAHDIEYTYSPQNIGICKALNLAAKKCHSNYLVYLNDDMYVLPGWDTALTDQLDRYGQSQPVYFSGTLIQSSRFSPSNVVADYGSDLTTFDEQRMLRDYRSGKLHRNDWNGATWPPSCIHRKWWDAVNGYSEEFSPGFYSDIDFSMKLWQIGCRNFHGVGSSLVYHFGEKTTSLVRGEQNHTVKRARIEFLMKWGILPSTFSRYYVHAGKYYRESTPEPNDLAFQFERARLAVLTAFYKRTALVSQPSQTTSSLARA